MAFALLGAPGRLSAQAAPPHDDTARARLHFEAGSSYYRDGDYRSALREYETAYRFAPRPALLYNIAQCWDRLGDKEKTVAYLRRYLEAEPGAEDRPAVERWIANLEQALKPQPAAPPPAPVSPPSATQAGPSTPPSAPTQKPPRGRFYTWIAAGTGLVLGAGGLTFGLLARSRYDDLKDGCGDTEVGCDSSDIDGVRHRALAANVLFGVSAAALATAGVLWFVDAPKARVGVAGSTVVGEVWF